MLSPKSQKVTVSLSVFGKNATFHSTYCICRKHLIPLFLWIHCILPKAHSFSLHLPTTISLTQHFLWKNEVWLHFFTKNFQNYPKTHSYEDNAKFYSTFLAAKLSYATRFWQKAGSDRKFWISGRIWRWFSKMLAVMCFVSISDSTKQKKVKNRLWKSRACVPLSVLSYTENMHVYRKVFNRHTLNIRVFLLF